MAGDRTPGDMTAGGVVVGGDGFEPPALSV